MRSRLLNTELFTGSSAIDNLHQDFITSLEKATTSSDSEFANRYAEFVREAERIFGIEEVWMDELESELIHSHREQHARVLGALHQTHSRVMAGDIALGREVTSRLVPQWFAFHTATMDTALSAALDCLGVQVSVHPDIPPNMPSAAAVINY